MTVKRVFIIAEAGVNHNGSLSIARMMVDSAKAAGADAIKFQTFKAENIASHDAPKAGYQMKRTGKKETQFDMLKKLELDEKEHTALLKYCAKKGIQFMSTPFDLESLELLFSLGLTTIKIPSGEINNYPYLKAVSKRARKVILSSGMSNMEEIAAAMKVLTSGRLSKKDITVLHCNTAYPSPFEDVNLLAMGVIRERFGVEVGYSDHTPGIEVSIAAAAMGASVIEKHFTLDRKMEGPDHKASLEPAELAALAGAIRNIEKAMGKAVKAPSPSERPNRSVIRKSIVAARDIKKGEMFSEKNLTAKRPAGGLSPMLWDKVIGKRAAKDFAKDRMIRI
jgi:N,N'-diacetyllegionaminate synthase